MEYSSSYYLHPIEKNNRIISLDSLRGFALFGILLMNIESIAEPFLLVQQGINPHWQGFDYYVDALIYFFIQGKFYPLFSLLFGMGFAVMSSRASESNTPFIAIYLRRSLVLMAFGLLHAIFIWPGDILLMYGFLALFLPLFRNFSSKLLAPLAFLLFMLPIAWYLFMGFLAFIMQSQPDLAGQFQQAMQEQGKVMSDIIQKEREIYSSGSFLEITSQRKDDLLFTLSSIWLTLPQVFSFFLLGQILIKSEVIQDPKRFPIFYAVLRYLLLPMGLVFMGISVFLMPTIPFDNLNVKIGIGLSLSFVAGILMCLGYVGWIITALQYKKIRAAFTLLAPAGRMALTHYIAQSVILTLIFYSYGLGLFEKISRTEQIIMAVFLFTGQVIFSHIWFRYFKFGPLEWIWRCITYWKWQPIFIK